jgi:hypothetical protein
MQLLHIHEPKNNHDVTVNKYFQLMKVQTRFTEIKGLKQKVMQLFS